MKALTLTQPWATLVTRGVKRIETRSWGTKYRGPLAIHAAKGLPREKHLKLGEWEADRDSAGMLLRGPIEWPYRLPLGAVVATCQLEDCIRILTHAQIGDGTPRWAAMFTAGEEHFVLVRDHTEVPRPSGDDPDTVDLFDELPFGDFTPGRWAWVLADIKRLPEPIPAKGALGLWEWARNGDLPPA